MRPKLLVVWGTRPEAIKTAPVLAALKRRGLRARTCVTAQHRGLLDQAGLALRLRPDIDLDLMRPGQSLEALTRRVLAAVARTLEAERPDMVLVQGDTTTAFAAALAAFYRRIPVGHIEAGLRTFDLKRPYPEEANRVLIDELAALRFAPTPLAARNLRQAGLRSGIHVTGNTVVDALKGVRPSPPKDRRLRAAFAEGRTVLMTAHRRENFGRPLEEICGAVRDLLERHPDLRVVYPVHPNPNVRRPVRRLLKHPRVLLVEPLGYNDLLWTLGRATLVLSDSGGIQEEAPSFGAPVVILRELTERPEAMKAGAALLGGTTRGGIFRAAHRLLRDRRRLAGMRRVKNPFGDGRAGGRIARAVAHYFGEGPRPKDWSPHAARLASARNARPRVGRR